MINRLLFKHIDNSALVVFRILFGFLIAAEGFGAIITGWVRITLVEPEFTFNFIGFEFLQPLPGNWMYIYYFVMGVFGVLVMIGYKYRFAIIAYGIMWAATYFMQKASYNNHYYLMVWLCGLMAILPANRYYSIDVKRNPKLKQLSMPHWCSWILILQMWIVYTYGSIAKIYPDWLDASVMEIFMRNKQHYFLIGEFLQERWLHYFLAYGGILFDGLAIPLLLYKPTRRWAFYASIFFHMFNSIVFQVGVFPYMSLALCIFFFDPDYIRRLFLKKKPKFEISNEFQVPNYRKYFLMFWGIYFLVHMALPLRHWFFKDNVLWTEEGHRLSWRMMLRAKSGFVIFKVVDKNTGEETNLKISDYLSKKQRRLITTHPDIIWQFAQRLKKQYAEKNQDIAIYVNSKISVNGRALETYIDPNIDLASVKWNAFKHSDWILPSKLD